MTLFFDLFLFLLIDALLSLRENRAIKVEASASGLPPSRKAASPLLKISVQTVVSLALWLVAWPLDSLLGGMIFRPLFVFAVAPVFVIGLSMYFYFTKSREIRVSFISVSRDLAYQSLGCALILVYCLKLLDLGIQAEFILFLSFSAIYATLVYVLRAIFKKHRPGEASKAFSGAPLLLIDIGLVALAASFLTKVDFLSLLGR
jgi:hypothetical protein